VCVFVYVYDREREREREREIGMDLSHSRSKNLDNFSIGRMRLTVEAKPTIKVLCEKNPQKVEK